MQDSNSAAKFRELETQLVELNNEIEKVRAEQTPVEVENYAFQTLNGEVTLMDLFAHRAQLLLIHIMGRQCPFCTLWADGINGYLPHLESVTLVSHETPSTSVSLL